MQWATTNPRESTVTVYGDDAWRLTELSWDDWDALANLFIGDRWEPKELTTTCYAEEPLELTVTFHWS